MVMILRSLLHDAVQSDNCSSSTSCQCVELQLIAVTLIH